MQFATVTQPVASINIHGYALCDVSVIKINNYAKLYENKSMILLTILKKKKIK